jgi:DNA-binding response OmpR family regulator
LGLSTFEPDAYDLVILDWMLPGADGLEVCEGIWKMSSDVPILFLTVKDATPDKVAGFEAGADDYLTKPFSFLELLARVRALMRRGSRAIDDLSVGGLKMSISQ